MVLTSLVSRPPPFFILRFSFSIIYTEAEEREKRGRPGNTHHVNDVWWTQGGRMGGGVDVWGGFAHQPTRVQ